MEIIKYIFYLGTVFITFELLWWLILGSLTLLSGARDIKPGVNLLLKGAYYYFLVTLSAIKTNEFMQYLSGAIIVNLGVSFIGLFVLYCYLTEKISRDTFKISINKISVDLKYLNKMRHESFLLFGALLFFLACLLFSSISVNIVTLWLYDVIGRIFDIPVIGWIIGFAGALFLIRILYRGINITGQFWKRLTLIFVQEKNNKQFFINNNITDAEIIEEVKMY